jgi:predicted dehydrogenase
MSTSRRFTRRGFLGAASGLAAPFILPSHIWSAPTGPNSKITMGFVGMGKQSRGLLRGFLSRDTRVVAVCDVDKTRREDAKAKVEEHYAKETGSSYKGCLATARFEELVARKDIDAIVIATPDHWHAIVCCAALGAGKDVYCEKPLTQTIHEAVAVVTAVEKNRRVFQTGSMQRSMKEFRIAAELVRNGVIGKLEKVDCSFGGPAVPCDLPGEEMEPGLDWDRWLGPAPTRPYNSILSPRGMHDNFPQWRKYREYGGGGVTDWGAHHLDITQWALGEDEKGGPVEVVPPEDWKTAQSGVKLIYGNGLEVNHCSGNGIVFHGPDGKITVNRGKIEFALKGETKAKFMSREDVPSLAAQLAKVEKEFLGDARVKLYDSQNHQDDFLDCIRTRKQPVASAAIGARTAICCHLVNFAYYYGRRMKWDPARLQFASGTGDASWLTRPYRGAWKV